MRKYFLIPAVLSSCLLGQEPLKAHYEDGANFRWVNKPVAASRVLDDMENADSWAFSGNGEMGLSDVHVKQGAHALRIHSVTGEATVGGDGEWTDMMATRKFAGEDWSGFNRLSLWVYPDVKGTPAISCTLNLHNDGTHKLPDRYNEGRNESIPLNNHQWNHVVWEITPLARDRVTAVDFGYSLPKRYPDPGDQTTLYIDQLELQSVNPDHVEGWDVAPGKIAFSGSGYRLGGPKTAIASDLAAKEFTVLRENSGETVLTHPVETVTTPLGKYQLLDFSALQEPGRYLIHAGDKVTRSFEIGDDAWRGSIEKAINFLYAERCGTVIPGVHAICHQDCYTEHAGRRIIVNGGYHDAGDLTATGNTPGVSYALFSLAQRLHEQGQDLVLEKRVVEEAKWGLRWVLKTRFGDGFRSTGQLISYWTNGVMGDADDRHAEAVNDPEWNFRVGSVEALAFRVLKESDPELAERSLETAKEDWHFAVKGLETAATIPPVYGQKDELERNSIGTLASVDLFEATGDQQYANEAFGLAKLVMDSQERKIQPWSIPLTGYFYSSPRKESLFQRFHMGEEQAPIVALARLCQAFPDHSDWMKWYSALVLHSKYYLEPAARVNEPYGVLAAAIYREGDAKFLNAKKAWTPLRAADSDAYLAEVRAGVPLGGEFYLRRLPVWFDFRGNFSVLLSQAKALTTEGRLRGDIASMDLAEKQAEWILGRNPFAASMMYGEGYDWTPLYSVRSGQMVGALPVGIQTKGFSDAPYWPNQIGWTYKEVWTHTVGRWIWLMADLAGPAIVSGRGDAGGSEAINFRDERTGVVSAVTVERSGFFETPMAEGKYVVSQGARTKRVTVVPGGMYQVDLRAERFLTFDATFEQEKTSGGITIRVTAHGTGEHQFAIRSYNLKVPEMTKRMELDGMGTMEWHCSIEDLKSPWVAIIVPDGRLNDRQEITATQQ